MFKLSSLLYPFDNHRKAARRSNQHGVALGTLLPFLAMHLACLGIFWVGWSPVALMVALLAYAVRMFAITGFYHRYFSHRSFKTSRTVQFLFAFVANSSAQRGPLWWAAHHREHHANSDQPGDSHSPQQQGLLVSHTAWFLSRRAFATRDHRVRDWKRFPELVWLDRFDLLAPVTLAVFMLLLGFVLQRYAPQLGTSGGQMLVWGFFVSTIVLYHATYTINSVAHLLGKRRFQTNDHSRNNWLLALITFGEGWHNNHHYYPRSTRQGFYWWEFDLTYYLLKLMAALGLVWELKPVPDEVLAAGKT